MWCRWYRVWEKFILLWAVYSSFFTPMEFGFFRGLPDNLDLLDIFSQVAFFIDIFLQFFVAYRDSQTYKIIANRRLIAIRYIFHPLSKWQRNCYKLNHLKQTLLFVAVTWNLILSLIYLLACRGILFIRYKLKLHINAKNIC